MKQSAEPPTDELAPHNPGRHGREPSPRLDQIRNLREATRREPEDVLNDVIQLRVARTEQASCEPGDVPRVPAKEHLEIHGPVLSDVQRRRSEAEVGFGWEATPHQVVLVMAGMGMKRYVN